MKRAVFWLALLPGLAQAEPAFEPDPSVFRDGIYDVPRIDRPYWRAPDRRTQIEALRGGIGRSSTEAQYELGLYYERGEEVPRDLTRAAYWYAKAAAKYHPDASYRLAILHEIGAGVEQDYAEALRLYREATLHDHADAYNDMLALLEPRLRQVATANARLRGGDARGPKAHSVAEFHRGERVYVFRQFPDWLYVYSYGQDRWGWLRASALEEPAPTLFNIELSHAPRGAMRARLSEWNLRPVREQDEGWFDYYDPAAVMEGADQLVVGYVRDNRQLAMYRYRFPTGPSINAPEQLVAMLERRYGKPDAVFADHTDLPWEYRWERGGMLIRLYPQQQGATLLSYEVPDAVRRMEAEIAVYERERGLRLWPQQHAAY